METPLLCEFVDFLAIRDANTPRRCDNLTAVSDKNWLIFHYATLLFLPLFYGFWVVAYILAHDSGRRLCTTVMWDGTNAVWMTFLEGGVEGFILYNKKEEHLCKFDCVLTTYVFPFCADSWYIHSSWNNALVMLFLYLHGKALPQGHWLKLQRQRKQRHCRSREGQNLPQHFVG